MTRVLVPIEVLEGETVSPGLVELLGTVDVTLLGYHVLPEQTPPDQARTQYGERATDALDDLSEAFRAAGRAADHRLVFTHDREQTLGRIAEEVGAWAVAIPGVTGGVDNLLVSLSGEVATDRILGFVTELVGDRDIGVTLLLAGDGQDRLDTATDRLRADGIDVGTTTTGDAPFESLTDAVPGYDAVVMGEAAPSLRSLVFGEETERVGAASVGPVLVVRSDDTQDLSR